MEKTNQHFDVIISGGGLSGSLMALSLSKLTKADGSLLSIAIVEAQAFNQATAVSEKNTTDENNLFDARVLALSHGSAKYLEKQGVWQYLKDDACAITAIDISDRGYFGKARLTAKQHNVNALGYVIDMALIGKAQLKALAHSQAATNTSIKSNSTSKNVHWFSPDSIVDIIWQEKSQIPDENAAAKALADKVKVRLSSGTILSAKLLLACDGVQSPVRQLANIEVTCDDYQQVALIANVSTSKAHHHKAFERFTEFGPIAMLPLKSLKRNNNSLNKSVESGKNSATGGSRCSLVWTMTAAQAKNINNLNDDEFTVELERAFGSYLGEIT